MSDITSHHEQLEEKVMQDVFEKSDAEFWLQLNDELSERFWQAVREYIANASREDLKFILRDFKRFSKSKP